MLENAMKYYAIRIGRKTGIFTSWDEAKEYVLGYKGAIYKSFTNKRAARSFLRASIDPPNLPRQYRVVSPKRKRTEIARYWEYAARREYMNKDRDRYKYSIQDRTFDYYLDRGKRRCR